MESLRPEPARYVLDDPRVQVEYVDGGAAAPGFGVWMNAYTFEALLQAAASQTERSTHAADCDAAEAGR